MYAKVKYSKEIGGGASLSKIDNAFCLFSCFRFPFVYKVFALSDGYASCNSFYVKRRFAFTLAEVLITLGIIGVVAAMTLPTLIQDYRNKVVESRLKKFYSTFNQAIELAEVEFGDRRYWYSRVSGVDLDDDGNPIESTAKIDVWFQKHFSQFLVYKKKILNNGSVFYYLQDGSAMQFGTTDKMTESHVITFYPGDPEKCTDIKDYGVCKFYFIFMPYPSTPDEMADKENYKYHIGKGLEPCKYAWDGTREHLYSLCNSTTGGNKYCTALIQYDNWTISKDYPHKVRY